VRAVVAVLRPDAGKTTATRALRAVEVVVSGRRDAREQGGCGEAFCIARGGLIKATLSSGAAVAVEMEKKKNTPVTVLSFYRATNVTSRRHVARRELTEANAGGRRHA
jgi:hypothetical protein